ncbi:transposase family protein [Streptomyces puniciscabiei]
MAQLARARPDQCAQPPYSGAGAPPLVDLGYENAGDGFRHPGKKPAGGELTEAQQTYNKVVRGIHGVCERANSLLKTTFKALQRVSLDPGRITQIAAAALVLLQLEYDRTI